VVGQPSQLRASANRPGQGFDFLRRQQERIAHSATSALRACSVISPSNPSCAALHSGIARLGDVRGNLRRSHAIS
jgi:aspartate/methionine/tyrosine aminotransferase